MRVFHRAMLSLKRKKGQAFILFAATFLMSTLVASSILVNNAIINTDRGLRAQLPAVAMLLQDEISFFQERYETGGWPHRENLTTTLLEQLGALPYVRTFNYTVQGHEFYSESLIRAWESEFFVQEARDRRTLSRQFETTLERFVLTGVGNLNIWDIEAEVINLVQGRVFNESDVERDVVATVVSTSFLNTNNLALGDTFLLEQFLYDNDITLEQRYEHHPEYIFDSQTHEFEIVGVFHHEPSTERELHAGDFFDHIEILNQIFVPARFIEQATQFGLEAFSNPYVLARFEAAETFFDALDFSHMYFLLYDPLDLPYFLEVAEYLLPTHWMMMDYSFVYAAMAESMALVRSMANGLFVGITLAMIIILSLVVLLFLYARRKEIGIYLAIGEFKSKIFTQIFLEFLLPTIVGVALALFIGHFLAAQVSAYLIEHNLTAITNDPNRMTHFYEIIGIRHEMTIEEMFEIYEVYLDISTVSTFYAVVLGVSFVAISAPMLLILNINPKEVLVSGEV